MTSSFPDRELLPSPLRVHRAGEAAVLAEYPDTVAVLATAAAVRALAPAYLVDLVPAERTLLLAGAAPRDLDELIRLLQHLPAAADERADAEELTLGVVYDGEDLAEAAALLEMSTDALITAHTAATWTAAFGGFAPGFAYLVADGAQQPVGPPPRRRRAAPNAAHTGSGERAAAAAWDVPRRAEPRTTVPAGAVGLASRYCGIYPRPSPGGWQLIGRTDAELFDPARTPPALLTPGTRVRFTAQRPGARVTVPPPDPNRAGRGAAAEPGSPARGRKGRAATGKAAAGKSAVGIPTGRIAALEVISPGPLLLLQDGGRPGQGAIGVSPSGAFDRAALVRANVAVGNPARSPVLEALLGPLHLRASAPTVVALCGAAAPLTVRRHDPEAAELTLTADLAREMPIALDPGDEIELGPVTDGLRLVIAVRGGIRGVRRAADARSAADATGATGAADAVGPAGTPGRHDAPGPDDDVLGSLSRDTLSGLGPASLGAGDALLVDPEHGLDVVPTPLLADPSDPGDPGDPSAAASLEVPVLPGPRDKLLGTRAVTTLVTSEWMVRSDSDRVGVRLDGAALPVPEDAGSLPSEAMVPGAIQVPPSGLPVVFGPDHPTTGGYPVIAVVTRAGLDLLAQAAPGTVLRFTLAD